MKSPTLLIIVLVAIAMTGCDKAGRYLDEASLAPAMQARFDADASAYVLGAGTSTVSGSATYNDGEELKIASNVRVRMYPVTAYTSEYFGHLFQGQAVATRSADVTNTDERFSSYSRVTGSDAEGNFTFLGIPEGDYYLYTTATGPSRAVVALYKRIIVQDGQNLNVVLDGK